MTKTKDSLLALMSDKQYQVIVENAGIFRFPANYRFETHAHRAYEINYINTGCCIMGVGKEYVPLKQGDCIVINPYTSHCFMVDVRRTCKITQLEIAVYLPEKKPEGVSFLENRTEYYKLSDCENVVQVLERICYYNRAHGEDENLLMQMDFCMVSLYAELSAQIDRLGSRKLEERQSRVLDVIQFINENLEEDMNLEEVADKFGISSRYIRKFFLQQLGMNCTDYIAALRIGRAKELLLNPDRSVTDVALMCGFNSSQYFCRIFKKQMGVTPMEYRQLWRDDKPEEHVYNV